MEERDVRMLTTSELNELKGELESAYAALQGEIRTRWVDMTAFLQEANDRLVEYAADNADIVAELRKREGRK